MFLLGKKLPNSKLLFLEGLFKKHRCFRVSLGTAAPEAPGAPRLVAAICGAAAPQGAPAGEALGAERRSGWWAGDRGVPKKPRKNQENHGESVSLFAFRKKT